MVKGGFDKALRALQMRSRVKTVILTAYILLVGLWTMLVATKAGEKYLAVVIGISMCISIGWLTGESNKIFHRRYRRRFRSFERP